MEAINARFDLYKERKKIVFDKECAPCVLIAYLTFTLRASLNVMLRYLGFQINGEGLQVKKEPPLGSYCAVFINNDNVNI